MKCKKCKSLMIMRGFKDNRRYECKECGFVYVSWYSRMFGSYIGYPKYMERWETFLDWREDE